MASGTIAQPPITGTSNGWTYMRVGNNVFAWYFGQITEANVSTQWVSGTYRSGELQAAPYPTFLKDGYKVSASLAKGSQSAGINLGRVMAENNAIRVYLTCTASYTNVKCAVMVYAFGEWK